MNFKKFQQAKQLKESKARPGAGIKMIKIKIF